MQKWSAVGSNPPLPRVMSPIIMRRAVRKRIDHLPHFLSVYLLPVHVPSAIPLFHTLSIHSSIPYVDLPIPTWALHNHPLSSSQSVDIFQFQSFFFYSVLPALCNCVQTEPAPVSCRTTFPHFASTVCCVSLVRALTSSGVGCSAGWTGTVPVWVLQVIRLTCLTRDQPPLLLLLLLTITPSLLLLLLCSMSKSTLLSSCISLNCNFILSWSSGVGRLGGLEQSSQGTFISLSAQLCITHLL